MKIIIPLLIQKLFKIIIRYKAYKDMAKKNKKENKKGGTDPKAAALAFLNINLGSKNIRTLKKEEVHAAFVKQLHVSETT